MARPGIVTNASKLAEALDELLDEGMDDSDVIRITQHNGELRASLVTNGPTGKLNPEGEDEDEDDDLPLPTYNNKLFAKDLKLPGFAAGTQEDEDADDDNDDCLDLPQYDPAAFKIW